MNIDELYTKEHHEAGAEMQVNDEFGNPIDSFIMLAGMDSKLFKKAETELHREILKDNNIDGDKLKAEALSKTTIGWRGFDYNGKELEFSQETAFKLYYNAPYIMEQADNFIAKRANFTKG